MPPTARRLAWRDSHAAYGLELFFVREKLLGGDDIDRLLGLVQVQRRLKDHLVFQLIKKRRRIVRVRTMLAALALGNSVGAVP